MTPPVTWTPAHILAAVHAWVTAHQGHFLTQRALQSAQGLPNKNTVQKRIGSMVDLKVAYEQRYGSRAGWVVCPRCTQPWCSPDRYDLHQHSYAQRKAGQCRLPGQPRFARRRPRLDTAQHAPRQTEMSPATYKALIQSLLAEACWLLAQATPESETQTALDAWITDHHAADSGVVPSRAHT